MSDEMPAVQPPSAARTLALLPVIVVLITGYIAVGTVLGIAASLFAGFFFLVYWLAMKQGAPKEFAPTLLGGLGGLGLAWVIHTLPASFGMPGQIVGTVLLLAAIYVQIRDLWPLVINLPFMLFMTLGLVPQVAEQADFVGMGFAVIFAAAYFGGAQYLGVRLARRAATAKPA